MYEERSLGIYKDDTPIEIDEEGLRLSGSRMTVWGNYLSMHARKQLAFGTRPSHDKLLALVIWRRYVVAWPGPLPSLHNRGWHPIFLFFNCI